MTLGAAKSETCDRSVAVHIHFDPVKGDKHNIAMEQNQFVAQNGYSFSFYKPQTFSVASAGQNPQALGFSNSTVLPHKLFKGLIWEVKRKRWWNSECSS